MINPIFTLLESSRWNDYALLDSGDGLKLERFGKYVFVKPESQAMWKRSLDSEWKNAHAVFQPTGEESGGHWDFKKKVDEKWEMKYALTPGPSPARRGEIRFWAMTTPGRHLGVFPEVAAHWDWCSDLIAQSKEQPNILNLFGYTGLASLATAAAGCNRNDRANDALQSDLNLAAQANSQRSLDSISAVERGYAAPAAAPAAPTRTAPRRSSSTSTRSTSSSSGSAASAGTSAPATQSRTTVQKNTKRDAAIGAAAGAVIGATTSRDKVKGAVIGAAAGGILGGIIGNNVDVKKKKTP